MNYIDLRSDTVTKPSHAMLEAMMHAEVGDDVFGEDPTVNELQVRIAVMFGKQAALFVPSGTMGNEICIKAHTTPGDEIIVEQESHIFVYETAAPSFLSGVQMKTLKGEHGSLTAEQLRRAIRPNAYYLPPTKLVCLENTHGRSGGSILPLEELRAIYQLAKEHGINVHLDGARLWNACVASGVHPAEYARYCDSVSACFSKGLGAPVGSIIAGTKEFIDRALKYRKIFGGGMRQVGILAAAAIYAIDHNIDRLKEDHEKARYLAAELKTFKQFQIDMNEVQTNMVIIETEPNGKSQDEVLQALKSKGVLLTPERYSAIRAVMHLDVSMEQIQHVAAVFRSLFH